MKQFFSTALSLVCLVLVVALIAVKHGDNAQHAGDLGVIADFSNRLDSAHLQIATRDGTLFTMTNSLDECRAASLTLSNRLTETQSALALSTEQITNLDRQVAGLQSENQTLQTTLDQRVMDLTNRVAGLTEQLDSTRTNLDQAHKDYGLLENRLRRDVAERVVVEQKFNNPYELWNQQRALKQNPAAVVTPESIYAGLDVEVTSNSFHVLAPN